MNLSVVMSCLLVIFVLIIASVASAQASGQADPNTGCRLCHPSAHPQGWVAGAHAEFARLGPREMRGCINCHERDYCTFCHAAAP